MRALHCRLQSMWVFHLAHLQRGRLWHIYHPLMCMHRVLCSTRLQLLKPAGGVVSCLAG